MKMFISFVGIGDIIYEGFELDEEDVVVILYILGIIGKLKGVMLIYKNLYSNVSDVVLYL